MKAIRYHIVGGATGFEINSDLKGWSNSTTFRVNDMLVFNLVENQTVVQVTESEYESCIANNPIDIEDFDDNSGQAMIKLMKTGCQYFISDTPSICKMGVKVKVFVVDTRNNKASEMISYLTVAKYIGFSFLLVFI
ncbi:hypothetical protein BVRB_5g098540 [Beta vulgaris subsp. vulgaris]|nr:hypothetical protein BVRB_5g098540 [Beta vulgaris subsp. vulgaris]